MEEGDENFDWRLSFGEFKRLLSQSFQPSVKGEFSAGVGLETSLQTSETKNRNLPVSLVFFFILIQIETLSLTGDRVSLPFKM